MNRKLLVILIILILGVVGCTAMVSHQDNKIQAQIEQFQQSLEQQNYIYVSIDTGELISETVGYVKKEIVSKYLDGTLSGTIEVLHPYEANKSVIVNVNSIKKLEVNQ